MNRWAVSNCLVMCAALAACEPEKESTTSHRPADPADPADPDRAATGDGSPVGEYGDAPDEQPTLYLDPDAAQVGLFPSAFDTVSCRAVHGVGANVAAAPLHTSTSATRALVASLVSARYALAQAPCST